MMAESRYEEVYAKCILEQVFSEFGNFEINDRPDLRNNKICIEVTCCSFSDQKYGSFSFSCDGILEKYFLKYSKYSYDETKSKLSHFVSENEFVSLSDGPLFGFNMEIDEDLCRFQLCGVCDSLKQKLNKLISYKEEVGLNIKMGLFMITAIDMRSFLNFNYVVKELTNVMVMCDYFYKFDVIFLKCISEDYICRIDFSDLNNVYFEFFQIDSLLLNQKLRELYFD